ncbi:hypothetical protein [Chitinophaga parva]|nr:hypothetical protein [Chitinophaga parva]
MMYPPLTYVMIFSGLAVWAAAVYFTWRLSRDRQLLVSSMFTYALVVIALGLTVFCLLEFHWPALLINTAGLVAAIVLVITQFRMEERQRKKS